MKKKKKGEIKSLEWSEIAYGAEYAELMSKRFSEKVKISKKIYNRQKAKAVTE